jgi:hypothetical protein
MRELSTVGFQATLYDVWLGYIQFSRSVVMSRLPLPICPDFMYVSCRVRRTSRFVLMKRPVRNRPSGLSCLIDRFSPSPRPPISDSLIFTKSTDRKFR